MKNFPARIIHEIATKIGNNETEVFLYQNIIENTG